MKFIGISTEIENFFLYKYMTIFEYFKDQVSNAEFFFHRFDRKNKRNQCFSIAHIYMDDKCDDYDEKL